MKAKKLISTIMALAMILSLAVPFAGAVDKPGPADNGKTVTIKNEEGGHIYEAYQIFKGDLVTKYEEFPGNPAEYIEEDNSLKDADGNIVAVKDGDKWYTAGKNNDGKKAEKKTLTNVEFGADLNLNKAAAADTVVGRKNISNKTFLEAFNTVFNSALTASDNPKDYAEAMLAEIGKITDGEALADLFAAFLADNDPYASADEWDESTKEYKLTGLAEGYYFIKDKDGSLDAVKAYTDFILQVVEDTEVTAKADRPSIDKKIVETTDVKTGELKLVGYQKKDANGNDLYYKVKADGTVTTETTTIDTGYPVVVSLEEAGTGAKEIYANENGDFYALRVDENSASIGEWVRYEIPVTVPNMEGYSKYYYIITDTLSPGLTLPDNAFATNAAHPLKVEVEYEDGYRLPLTAKDGTLTYGEPAEKFKVIPGEKSYYYETATVTSTDVYNGGTKITLTLNDFIQYKTPDEGHGAAVMVYVTYDVQVNNKAIIGNPGNPNKVDLTYSRNPNITPDGDQNKPTDKDSDVTGKTPEEVVRTYITELILKKVDKDGSRPLTGAKFFITGTRQIPTKTMTERYIEFDPDEYGKDRTHPEVTAATHYLLKDGTWTDKAPTWDTVDNTDPDNPINKKGTYTKYADYDGTNTYDSEEAVNAAIPPKYYHYIETTVSYDPQELGTYVAADAENPATHYELKNGSFTDVAPTDETAANYKTYDGENISSIGKTHYFKAGLEYTVGSGGYLDLSGLGAGTYTITETKAPEGYNLLRESIEVVIEFIKDDEATTSDGEKDYFSAKWKKSSEAVYKPLNLATEVITVDHKTSTDAVKTLVGNYWLLPIENRQGNELPETGGIGTKIFYTLGGALVIAAGVILITRRRAEEG